MYREIKDGDRIVIKGVLKEIKGGDKPLRVTVFRKDLCLPMECVTAINGVTDTISFETLRRGDVLYISLKIANCKMLNNGIYAYVLSQSAKEWLHLEFITIDYGDIVSINGKDIRSNIEDHKENKNLVSLSDAICKLLSNEWEYAECIESNRLLRKGETFIEILGFGKKEYCFKFYSKIQEPKTWRKKAYFSCGAQSHSLQIDDFL